MKIESENEKHEDGSSDDAISKKTRCLEKGENQLREK